MATETEEFLMRMGFNADAVTRGTTDMLARQRRASQEYVGFWQAAMKEREISEIASAEKIAAERLAIEKVAAAQSFALYEANMANKKALDEAWMAERAAQLEIAGGSGAFGSIESAAAGTAASSAAGSLKSMAHEGGKFAGILRESSVLVREGMRGNFNRMIGSFSILAGMISGIVMPIVIGTAIVTGFSGYKTYKAYTESKESESDLKEKYQDLAGDLRSRVEAMKKTGVLSEKDADHYLKELKKPTYENVSDIQNVTNKLLAKQEKAEQIDAFDERIKKAQEEADAINEKERNAAEYGKDEQQRLKQNAYLKGQIAKLDKDSVESAHLQSIIAENNLQIEKDKVKVRQEIEKLQGKEENIRAKMDANKKKLSESAAEYPALSDLAGRDWTKAFAAQYGKGGQFDLGLGNGPLAELAREATRAKYQQIWDRTYGNTAMAEQDRVRQMNALSKLSQYGAASPEQNMQLVAEQTRSMAIDLQSLIKQEAELAVNLKGVEDKP